MSPDPHPIARDGYQAPASLDRVRQRALMLGAVALAATGAGAFGDSSQFFHAYLLAFLFVLGAALGCLALLMLQHLTGGGWGVSTRRILEAGAGTLPWLAVFFLPILIGLRAIFPWANPAVVAGDHILEGKAAYLNVTFFTIRAACYFAIWSTLAWLLVRWSSQQDRSADPALAARLRRVSAAGLVLYVVTMTFASVDWAMSIEPHWFSTMYGFLFVAGQALTGLAVAIITARRLSLEPPMDRVYNAGHFHDLGKLLFAFTMVWAYLSFSQFLIIWSANLPEEIPWYLHRTGQGWERIGIALVALHFLVPFMVLLSRRTKRNALILSRMAMWMVGARLVDLFYIVGPEFHPAGLATNWMEWTAALGLGGIWVSLFLTTLTTRPLLPVNEPELAAAIAAPHH
jgi:hypothetical protein